MTEDWCGFSTKTALGFWIDEEKSLNGNVESSGSSFQESIRGDDDAPKGDDIVGWRGTHSGEDSGTTGVQSGGVVLGNCHGGSDEEKKVQSDSKDTCGR